MKWTDSTRKELLEQRTILTKQLDAINFLLDEHQSADATGRTVTRRSSNTKEVADVAYKVLEDEIAPMHRETLLEFLLIEGLSIRPDATTSQKLSALSAILSKDARFKSEGHGTGLWSVDHDHVARGERFNGEHDDKMQEPSRERIFQQPSHIQPFTSHSEEA